MNRNTNITLFGLMALEIAIIAELMNNLVVVVVDETETPNLDDYDDYDFPQTDDKDETYLNRSVVDKTTYGEEDVVDWLVNDCGLDVNKSATDYAPNTKMMALSVDEMRQIKREFDTLKIKAEEGEHLAQMVRELHDTYYKLS